MNNHILHDKFLALLSWSWRFSIS